MQSGSRVVTLSKNNGGRQESSNRGATNHPEDSSATMPATAAMDNDDLSFELNHQDAAAKLPASIKHLVENDREVVDG